MTTATREQPKMDRYERAALRAANRALDELGCRPVERLLPGELRSATRCSIALTVRGPDRGLEVTVECDGIRVSCEEHDLEVEVPLDSDAARFIERVDAGRYGHLAAGP